MVLDEEWGKFLEIAGNYCREKGAISVERCNEHERCLIVLMPEDVEERHIEFALGEKQ